MPISVRRSPVVPLAIAAGLLTAFLVLFAPLAASAHDSLLESSPAADQTVETLPGELTLTFSAKLIAGDGATALVVTDAKGADVTAGAPTVNGAIVTQPLVAEADAGVYHVVWKVVSSDGHPTSGEFSFTVANSSLGTGAPVAPSPSAEPSEEATPETSAAPTEDTVEGTPADGDAFLGALPWIILGLVVAAGGGAAIAVMVAKSRRGPEAPESDDSSAR